MSRPRREETIVRLFSENSSSRRRKRQKLKLDEELTSIEAAVDSLAHEAYVAQQIADTRNLSEDRNKINAQLSANRHIALGIYARLDHVRDIMVQIPCSSQIERYNDVLRRFFRAVELAEAAEHDFQNCLQQRLLSRADSLSAMQVGERYFLVQNDQIAQYNLNDLKHWDNELSNLQDTMKELHSISTDVQQQVGEIDAVLFDEHLSKGSSHDHVLEENIEHKSAGSTTQIPKRTENSLDRNTHVEQTIFRRQRNIAIALGLVSAIVLTVLSVILLREGRKR